MKGDFSKWRFDPRDNFRGLLYQQGRVMDDADLTEAEFIALGWQEQAGRDVIGAGVAAVPAADADGFRVESAAVSGGQVHLRVHPGRVWADGILGYLPPDPAAPTATVERVATYFGPPLSDPIPAVSGIADGVRDAVVLEVSREEVNAFQDPDRLIEPALGGPDTAERIHTRLALRLYRLGRGEDCHSIAARLADGDSGKGRLSVSLEPVTPGGTPDCPVVAGGGYTGFEHNLYRIEIVATGGGPVRFAWSQFNGGLVGSGTFDATTTPNKVVIHGNRAAIVNSGLTEFYLEAMEWDAVLGHWRVTYGTPCTLDAQHDLQLTAPPAFGTLPGSAGPVFFRLWNGLRSVADFTSVATPGDLRDGIRLVFDPPTATNYRPGDYWTFAVRAGEIRNRENLIDARPPHGVRYHRVPLAEIHWTGRQDTTISGSIDDCRSRFRPLTNQKVCCTFLVGNGLTSFGDFNSLEEAARHLPAAGGELCLLPGIHTANLLLDGRRNVVIHGCPRRTRVYPRATHPSEPLFQLRDCLGVEIYDLDLVQLDGTCVMMDASAPGQLRDVSIHDTRMLARINTIRANGATGLTIARNRLHLVDTPQGRATISVEADDCLIERNTLLIVPADQMPPDGGPDRPPGQPTNPADPCAEAAAFYATPVLAERYLVHVWVFAEVDVPQNPYFALGGLHLRAGSERVRILENQIRGGAGNGILLGGTLDAAAPAPTFTAAPQPSTSTSETAPPVPRLTVGSPGIFTGVVQDHVGNPLANVDIYLQGPESDTDRSNAQGLVTMTVRPGSYTAVAGAPWRISQITESDDARGVAVHAITVVPLSGPEALARGFLHEITIAENEIVAMGLSGIGFGTHPAGTEDGFGIPNPVITDLGSYLLAFVDLLIALLSPRDLITTTDPVRDLVVRGNRIHHCLRNPFDDDLRKDALLVGRGGISLALVDAAVIAQNHIYDNGPRATDPVCGVFVGYGNNVEITDNVLAGNGALTTDYETSKLEGIRGGIYLRFAGALTRRYSTASGRQPALRVHDNRVDQPAGRALTALAFGPVSCANNHLSSERTGRFGFWDQAVGGVLILNLGGIHRLLARLLGPSPGNRFVAEPLINLDVTEEALPGGETVIDANYVRVGSANRSSIAQLVGTLDDLGYDGNQAAALRRDALLVNAVLAGMSLRATDSRFREDVALTLSLLSLGGVMNITAHNQADHCIIALPFPAAGGAPLPTIAGPNQELASALCDQLRSGAGMKTHLENVLPIHIGQTGETVDISALGQLSLEQLATDSAAKAYRTVKTSTIDQRLLYQRETTRQTFKVGAQNSRVLTLKAAVERTGIVATQLGVASEVVAIKAPPAPAGGVVIDGRVTDEGARGRAGLTVDLIRADGRRLEALGVTDPSGYYGVALSPERATALAREKTVVIRVRDASGKDVFRSTETLRIQPGQPLRSRITLPKAGIARAVFTKGSVIFDARGGTGAPPSPPPGYPDPPPGSSTPTPSPTKRSEPEGGAPGGRLRRRPRRA